MSALNSPLLSLHDQELLMKGFTNDYVGIIEVCKQKPNCLKALKEKIEALKKEMVQAITRQISLFSEENILLLQVYVKRLELLHHNLKQLITIIVA